MADDDTPGSLPEEPASRTPRIAIEDEMARSYMDYAMSVIVSRALPDARDGLKPVQRRILYAMGESNLSWNRPYRKAARVVGEVMGKYHPHGDQAIYDALARMAQDFSMRAPLIDGQGNYGSLDGDPPAAMRYTEARLTRQAQALLDDLEFAVADWRPTYDASSREPVALPARYPNLLINGASGIAVGMATNIAPHNPGEIIRAARALLANPDLQHEELLAIVPGPDFPGGGLIVGRTGSVSAARTGRGSIVVRGKTAIETRGKIESVIISEIPYQVSKSVLVERIADAARAGRIEGVAALRDESDRDGVRVVVDLKRSADPAVALNQLRRHTPLESVFHASNLALDNGAPRTMNLRDMLRAFLDFRADVIARRTRDKLHRARTRAHAALGLVVAVANIDEVLAVIRAAKDSPSAREALLARDWDGGDIAPLLALVDDPRAAVDADGRIRLSKEQAQAILDLRLARLTGLGREELANELDTLAEAMRAALIILSDPDKARAVMDEELAEMETLFASPRRTQFDDDDASLEDEDFIADDPMTVVFTKEGYVKRTPASEWRRQRRGGKGKAGMDVREGDEMSLVVSATARERALIFTDAGMAYRLPVWRLPLGPPRARGRPLVNYLRLKEGEKPVSAMVQARDVVAASPDNAPPDAPPPDEKTPDKDLLAGIDAGAASTTDASAASTEASAASTEESAATTEESAAASPDLALDEDDMEEGGIVFVTRGGMVRRSPARAFASAPTKGKIAMTLKPGDAILAAAWCESDADVILITLGGMAIRFNVRKLREIRSRASRGVRGIRLAPKDEVIALMPIASDLPRGHSIVLIDEIGRAKRLAPGLFTEQGRGGKGVAAFTRPCRLAAAFLAEADDEMTLITDKGQSLRARVGDIPYRRGRATGGVYAMRLDGDDKDARIVSAVRLSSDDDKDSA